MYKKTFFIVKARIGIQFLGIGYFPDTDSEKYPLSCFIKKLQHKKYGETFKLNAKYIFNFLQNISNANDTGQYVKGVMSGFAENGKSYICIFNTFDNSFDINEFNVGQFMDSENNKCTFPLTDIEIVKELSKRINTKSIEKSWSIGGIVEILKITIENGVFIKDNKTIFNGTQKELLRHFISDPEKIKGKILECSHLEKYDYSMKTNWQPRKLGDARVFSVDYGTRVVKKRDGGSIYDVYGGGGKTFFMDSYNRENQLIVARFAMSERCTRFVKDKFFLNDSGLTVSINDKKEILQVFLNYYFIFLNNHIYSLAKGSAQKNLDVPAFRKIEISYPSLHEQKRIVGILYEVFGDIGKARENAEKNLRNSKELFESYLQSVFENPGEGWEKKS